MKAGRSIMNDDVCEQSLDSQTNHSDSKDPDPPKYHRPFKRFKHFVPVFKKYTPKKTILKHENVPVTFDQSFETQKSCNQPAITQHMCDNVCHDESRVKSQVPYFRRITKWGNPNRYKGLNAGKKKKPS